MAFRTLAADTAPVVNGFPIDNDEFDFDNPTEGFASIPEAIEDIRQGKILYGLGVHTMKLMTNNPSKYIGLKGYGLTVSSRVPLLTPITKRTGDTWKPNAEKWSTYMGLSSTDA